MCSVNPPDVSKLALTEEETSAEQLVASGGAQQPQPPHKSTHLPPPSTKKLGFLKRMKTDMNFFNRISAPPIAEQSAASSSAKANSYSTNSSDSADTDSATADARKVSSSSAAASVGAASSPLTPAPEPRTPSKGGSGAERKQKSSSASVVSNWHKLAHSASRAANRLSVPIGPRIFLSPPGAGGSQTSPKAGSSSPSPFHTPVHAVRSDGSGRLLLEQQAALGGSSISIHSTRGDGFSDDGSTRTSPSLGSRLGYSQAAPDWLDDVRAVLERHRPSKERVRSWSANFTALLSDKCTRRSVPLELYSSLLFSSLLSLQCIRVP